MSLTCILPGLLWPIAGAQEALTTTPLPGLTALLARAKITRSPAQSLNDYLCSAFKAPQPAPLAALRCAGEQDATLANGYWLCADPVNLRFNRQHLLLSGAEQLDITMSEAAAMIASLNQTFADIGKFHAATPTRWYLQVASAPRIAFAPLDEVIGRPIAHFPPEGADAKFWNQTTNELQVFCHNHPVNLEREARGLPRINSLWLWGGGSLADGLITKPAACIAADQPLARGLALAAKCPLMPAEQWAQADFCVIDSLQGPAMARDLDAWLAALQALDASLFSPLAQHHQPMRFVAPGDTALLQIATQQVPTWHIWHKTPSLAGGLCIPDN